MLVYQRVYPNIYLPEIPFVDDVFSSRMEISQCHLCLCSHVSESYICFSVAQEFIMCSLFYHHGPWSLSNGYPKISSWFSSHMFQMFSYGFGPENVGLIFPMK